MNIAEESQVFDPIIDVPVTVQRMTAKEMKCVNAIYFAVPKITTEVVSVTRQIWIR